MAGSLSRIRADNPRYNSYHMSISRLANNYLEIGTRPAEAGVGNKRASTLMIGFRRKACYGLNSASLRQTWSHDGSYLLTGVKMLSFRWKKK